MGFVKICDSNQSLAIIRAPHASHDPIIGNLSVNVFAAFPFGHQIRNADVINAFVVIRSIEILCFVITHCFGVNTLETTNFIMNSHMSGNIPTDILVTNTTNSSLGSSFQKLGSVRVSVGCTSDTHCRWSITSADRICQFRSYGAWTMTTLTRNSFLQDRQLQSEIQPLIIFLVS